MALVRRPRLSEGSAVLLAALALVTAVYLATPVDGKDRGFDGDGKFYAAITGEKSFDPSRRFFAPYCWRVPGSGPGRLAMV